MMNYLYVEKPFITLQWFAVSRNECIDLSAISAGILLMHIFVYCVVETNNICRAGAAAAVKTTEMWLNAMEFR